LAVADRPEAILIAGPTASGKSALALEMARRTGGVIVNADSMQVYDALPVLTARPGPDELAQAEHRLYGHVPADAPWSVALWLADARAQFEELRAQRRTAIFTGGTGLYFKALTEGISVMPQPDPQIRAHWRAVAASEPQRLHGELARRDEKGAALLEPADRQRLVRALEVFDSTGVPISHFQAQGAREPVLEGMRVEKYLVELERAELHARIARRFDTMLAAGALDEVRALLALDLPPSTPVMKAIGVPQLAAFIKGETSREEAVEAAKAATRQYAKRQSTWFRHQLGGDWVAFLT
jgi:tRNA dimethylallyltransferase